MSDPNNKLFFGEFGNQINPAFNNIYSVNTSSSGHSDLVINSAALSLAGKYICIEDSDNDIPDQYETELVVLALHPNCNFSVIEIDSNNTSTHILAEHLQYELTAWCSVKYRGNVAPVMEWRRGGIDGAIIKEGIKNTTFKNENVTFTLNVKLNSSQAATVNTFTCITKLFDAANPNNMNVGDVLSYTFSWNFSGINLSTLSIDDENNDKKVIEIDSNNSNNSITLLNIVLILIAIGVFLTIAILILLKSKTRQTKKRYVVEPDVIDSKSSSIHTKIESDEHAEENSNEAVSVIYSTVNKTPKTKQHECDTPAATVLYSTVNKAPKTSQHESKVIGKDGTAYEQVSIRGSIKSSVAVPQVIIRDTPNQAYALVDHTIQPPSRFSH
jgi:hypothetical protein